ncbi:MAG: UDP-N-acetylglucosamine 1-carboxyvinyltransferase [Clostridia bacterium]|nr:UDP-N-acetylglucosamine 1-carboxyvinyltransferase [Clostridia bacterium]
MSTYWINGGKCLRGEVEIQGSKNASLPILAGSILSGKKSVIENCPIIRDTIVMKDLLEELGCKVAIEENCFTIDSSQCDKEEIPSELMKEMRSSIILMGALLARHKRLVLTYPGGCEIGARPIDLHLNGLRKLGAEITESHGFIVCRTDRLTGCEIDLDFPSVGATENIMLAAVLAEGRTIIRNAAREPEIVELQNYLNSMGAKISGASSNLIKIDGVEHLQETKYRVHGDRIVAGTYLCAAAITGGEITIKGVIPEYIRSTLHKLQEMNCVVKVIGEDSVYLKAPQRLRAVNTIKTMPFPGFPTDMQSQIVAALSVADGTSIVIENIFENRYKYISELTKMGAKITIEGKTAIVKGTKKLLGATVEAKDLRGGAALVLAGLVAEGYTTVEGVTYIERGYENFVENLRNLGASIEIRDERL